MSYIPQQEILDKKKRVKSLYSVFNIIEHIKSIISGLKENPIHAYTFLAIAVTMVVIVLSLPVYMTDWYNLYIQILAEMHGLILDILILGVLMVKINRQIDKRREIRTCISELDAFRHLKDFMISVKTIHNISKLNTLKIYEELRLHEYNLPRSNMSNLIMRSSLFHYTELDHSKIDHCDFLGSKMSYASLNGIYTYDCIFTGVSGNAWKAIGAQFHKSKFNESILLGANFSDSEFRWVDFHNANLDGVIFTNCSLLKVNFKGAKNLTIDQFRDVKDIKGCYFDEPLKSQIDILVSENAMQPSAEKPIRTAQRELEEQLKDLEENKI